MALHPMGFSVPPRLRLERWALTPPFHPYPALVAEAGAVCFSVALSVGTPHGIASRVYLTASLLALARPVTRHRALWSSDFPPPPDLTPGKAILRPSKIRGNIAVQWQPDKSRRIQEKRFCRIMLARIRRGRVYVALPGYGKLSSTRVSACAWIRVAEDACDKLTRLPRFDLSG